MKTNHKITAAFTAALLACAPAWAEDVKTEKSATTIRDATGTTATSTTKTTTTAGTISEFSPNTIVVRSTTSPEPISYTYTKTTTYVDDAGNPVSMEMVKSGLPVTVHYSKVGDAMTANKVIVHKRKTTTTAPAVIGEERSTSTTTTTEKKKDED